jgi:hypothetical protein
MDIALQLWGGGFYLLNKICFAFAEGKNEETKRRLKLAGWMVYLFGVPAWVAIFIGKHDWIAASIETGAVPSMLFGLLTVYQKAETPNKILDIIAAVLMYTFLISGVAYSFYDHGGITSSSQVLEIGAMIGFLVGSYLLAKNNSYGWLFFMLMNVSMAALMLIQGKPFLTVQQLISLGFVIYGFITVQRTSRQLN